MLVEKRDKIQADYWRHMEGHLRSFSQEEMLNLIQDLVEPMVCWQGGFYSELGDVVDVLVKHDIPYYDENDGWLSSSAMC